MLRTKEDIPLPQELPIFSLLEKERNYQSHSQLEEELNSQLSKRETTERDLKKLKKIMSEL
jgi:hypothetical protein